MMIKEMMRPRLSTIMLLFLQTIMDLKKESHDDMEMMRPRLSTIILLFLHTIIDPLW